MAEGIKPSEAERKLARETIRRSFYETFKDDVEGFLDNAAEIKACLHARIRFLEYTYVHPESKPVIRKTK